MATSGYVIPLVEAMSENAQVSYFSWRTALLSRYDILLTHWPEFLIRHDKLFFRIAKRLLFRLLLLRLRFGPVIHIRTMHNESPHEDGAGVEKRLLRSLDRLASGYVVLNGVTRVRANVPVVEIPHGSYIDLYPGEVTPFVDRIIHFGALRAYKGIDELLAAFAEIDSPSASLHVAGSVKERSVEAVIKKYVRADSRISVHFGFLSDTQLAEEVAASALAVLPYTRILNSGSAIFAVSMGTPVLMPESPGTIDLRDSVGAGWVYLYSGKLRAEHIECTLADVRERDMQGPPSLNGREWSQVAARYLEFFREVMDSSGSKV